MSERSNYHVDAQLLVSTAEHFQLLSLVKSALAGSVQEYKYLLQTKTKPSIDSEAVQQVLRNESFRNFLTLLQKYSQPSLSESIVSTNDKDLIDLNNPEFVGHLALALLQKLAQQS